MRITPNLIENLEFADIVRGSNEDFEVIYKLNDADKVYHSEISFYCKNFICTRGKDPISVHAEGNFHKDYDIESLKTVSTIGAGDTFNAGFIYGLLHQHITRDDIQNGLTETQWDRLIASGKAFSAECCKDIYNYVGKEFGLLKKQELWLYGDNVAKIQRRSSVLRREKHRFNEWKAPLWRDEHHALRC